MTRVCIISDTHGLIRDEVLKSIQQSDIVIHAGDICDLDLIQNLSLTKKVYAVRGNNDLHTNLPHSLAFEIEGVRLFVVHEKSDIPFGKRDVDVIIYGHSHKFTEERAHNILYLNPGAAGYRRFGLGLSYVIMDICAEKYSYTKIDIDQF